METSMEIKLVASIAIAICLPLTTTFAMEKQNYRNISLDDLVAIAAAEANYSDDIKEAADILTTLKNKQYAFALLYENNNHTYIPLSDAVKREAAYLTSKVCTKNFIKYVTTGVYKTVEYILNNSAERAKVTILSDSEKMFKLISALIMAKRQLNVHHNDISALTLEVLLNDVAIRSLFNTDQVNKFLTRLTRKGNALRMKALIKHNDLAEKINIQTAQEAVMFLARRGQNAILQVLLDNESVCMLLEQETIIQAFKSANEGQADGRFRRSVLCTLMENDIIYNLIQNLDLTCYLSHDSLQYVYRNTQNQKVVLLIEKLRRNTAVKG